MARGAMIRLRWVQRWRDSVTGNTYHYFRRPGAKRVRLPGLPGSAEFNAAYEAALSGERLEIGNKRTRAGSFSALTVAFYNSKTFHELAPSTKKTYRRIAESIRKANGDKAVATLTAADIRLALHKRASKPGAAVNFLKVLRLMMELAVELSFRSDNPCIGIKLKEKRNKEGFREWENAQIDKFKLTHPVGTRARLAFALLLETVQRRSDVIRMGRQHERDGIIGIKQKKTGQDVSIPVTQELREAIDACPNNHLTFLTTQYGEPFTEAGFGNWFREQCDLAGLQGYSAHGLRKSGCRRMADRGCTAHEIMAVSGHQTLKEVERYTRNYDRAQAAKNAMEKIGGRKTGT